MQNLLRVALLTFFLSLSTTFVPLEASETSKTFLSSQLQQALNRKDFEAFASNFLKASIWSPKKDYNKFLNEFPNARWRIRQSSTRRDGSSLLEIIIDGEKGLGADKYYLKAKQLLEIKVKGGKIVNKLLISEETIIQKRDNPLSISLNIPDEVLTGTIYDFDIILNDPLGDSIIAGGLIPITTKQFENQKSPGIELSPLSGGGLFKSVKAPLSPGFQNWAAVLAHPEGIITVTKRVRVVTN